MRCHDAILMALALSPLFFRAVAYCHIFDIFRAIFRYMLTTLMPTAFALFLRPPFSARFSRKPPFAPLLPFDRLFFAARCTPADIARRRYAFHTRFRLALSDIFRGFLPPLSQRASYSASDAALSPARYTPPLLSLRFSLPPLLICRYYAVTRKRFAIIRIYRHAC